MKKFHIFYKPDKGYKAVKEGPNYVALIFGPWWAGFKCLWKQLGIYLAIALPLGFWLGYLSQTQGVDLNMTAFLFEIGYRIYFCRVGNQWVYNKLEKDGFKRIDTIVANKVDQDTLNHYNFDHK